MIGIATIAAQTMYMKHKLRIMRRQTMSNKRTLNFWGARKAVRSGKLVRAVGGDRIFDATEFNGTRWSHYELDGDWEIVEEPRHKTYCVNVYDSYIGEGVAIDDTSSRISCIAITVDENGRLIEARNV
jgi:hypothetical protein